MNMNEPEVPMFDMQALRMSLMTGMAAGLGTLGLYMFLSSGDDNEDTEENKKGQTPSGRDS